MPQKQVTAMLSIPEPGRQNAERFVADQLSGLYTEGELPASPRIRGGQSAADAALAAFDVSGYAGRRNNAYPERERGASRLSPYIRHGLLQLPHVWDAVAEGPSSDVRRFHDELLWQEYARHWYARLGSATAAPLRRDYRNATKPTVDASEVWDQDMACLELTIGELEDDGWLVNQTRMWLASHWTVRNGRPASVRSERTGSPGGRLRSGRRDCALPVSLAQTVRSTSGPMILRSPR